MSAKEEKGKSAEGAAEAAPKGGAGRKLIPMVVAVVVVLGLQVGLAVGVVRYIGVTDQAGHKPKPSGEEEESKKEPENLECWERKFDKTVSIAGTDAKRYLKTTMCLEYDPEKFKDFPKKAEPHALRFEAVINQVLSAAPYEVIKEPANQAKLSKTITEKINEQLKGAKLKIHDVLITEWIIQ